MKHFLYCKRRKAGWGLRTRIVFHSCSLMHAATVVCITDVVLYRNLNYLNLGYLNLNYSNLDSPNLDSPNLDYSNLDYPNTSNIQTLQSEWSMHITNNINIIQTLNYPNPQLSKCFCLVPANLDDRDWTVYPHVFWVCWLQEKDKSTGIQLGIKRWMLLPLSQWTHGRGAEACLLITAMLAASADCSCLSLFHGRKHCLSLWLEIPGGWGCGPGVDSLLNRHLP